MGVLYPLRVMFRRRKRRSGRGSSKPDSARGRAQSSTQDGGPRATQGGAPEPYETEAASAVGPKDKAAESRRGARAFLLGAAQAAVLIPFLFYLNFGEINAFALSFTGFIVVLCLLVALGYSVSDRPIQETRAAGNGGPFARVGSFWLFACAFGPFFGWLVTEAYTLTEENWRWRYVARVALCAGLPVATALPLFAYARGKYRHVALALLMCVTALPVWSGLNTMLDLREGPTVKTTTGIYDAPHNSFFPTPAGSAFRLKTLAHTGRAIKIEPAGAGD